LQWGFQISNWEEGSIADVRRSLVGFGYFRTVRGIRVEDAQQERGTHPACVPFLDAFSRFTYFLLFGTYHTREKKRKESIMVGLERGGGKWRKLDDWTGTRT
jgi:hypothetical protein